MSVCLFPVAVRSPEFGVLVFVDESEVRQEMQWSGMLQQGRSLTRDCSCRHTWECVL